MPFNLTDAELERAKAAIEHHGYGVFFPPPPEWEVVRANWVAIRDAITKDDLDQYKPREPLRTYAPKSRINLRPVALLHPHDVLIYTALTLILRDDIENARDPATKKRVFSHRSKASEPNVLYRPSAPAHESYRARQRVRALLTSCKVVAVTDVADFFPRIYQHRLENILKTVASTQRATDAANTLARRFLLHVANRDSYGLPVGPLASSVLAEAILIDVDLALSDAGFDFVRWFDDYSFFCRSDAEAQRALFFVAEWLHQHHGLALNSAKTKILSKASFLRGIAKSYEQRIKDRTAALSHFWDNQVDDYTGTPVHLTPEERTEFESLDLAQILREALDKPRGVDYEMAAFLLGRLSAASVFSRVQALDLINVVISRIPDLYPVIDSVATFFNALEDVPANDRKRIAKALLAPFRAGAKPIPDFVAMWILSIFGTSALWNHAAILRSIYSGSASPVVKRYAALALAVIGDRPHALASRPDFVGAKPLVRTAILKLWSRMGADEKGHWKLAAGVSDPLEKVM